MPARDVRLDLGLERLKLLRMTTRNPRSGILLDACLIAGLRGKRVRPRSWMMSAQARVVAKPRRKCSVNAYGYFDLDRKVTIFNA
jgi:hypothetical protein